MLVSIIKGSVYAMQIGLMRIAPTTPVNATRTVQSAMDLTLVIVMNALKTRLSMNLEYATVMITTLTTPTHVVNILAHVIQYAMAVQALIGATVSTVYITLRKMKMDTVTVMTGGQRATVQSTKASVTANVIIAMEKVPPTVTSAQRMHTSTTMVTVFVTSTGMMTVA